MPGPDPLAPCAKPCGSRPITSRCGSIWPSRCWASGRPGAGRGGVSRGAGSARRTTLRLKLGLARAFLAQQKASAALVIVEDLIKAAIGPGQAHVLYARLLFNRGEVPQAVAQYKLGVEKDADAADEEFAGRLGIDATLRRVRSRRWPRAGRLGRSPRHDGRNRAAQDHLQRRRRHGRLSRTRSA